jgi:3-methyl-2-oxobutanoate hydroxymethyltransferase
MKNIISSYRERKGKSPISVVTCYDASFARLIQDTEIDSILVGDSLGMVIQGHGSTLPVTLEEMIYHTKAVKRGAPDKYVIIDLPFLSYQTSLPAGIEAAGRAMKETNASAVKLEGSDPETLELIRRLTAIGIPVMGHLGLTPQSYQTLGGYKVQGKDPESASKIKEGSKSLQEAGAFSMVLEMIPESLGAEISKNCDLITIGIGAGSGTDGQVLVLYDLLGLNPGFRPKFLKRYLDLENPIREALNLYHTEVTKRSFPDSNHSF